MAARSAARRSAGISGGAMKGRPRPSGAEAAISSALSASVIKRERHDFELRMGLGTVLKQGSYLGLGIPVRTHRLDARPEWRGHGFDLAVLQRQQDFVLSGIAGDQACLHIEELIEDAAIERGRRGRARAAGHHLLRLCVGERLDLGGVPDGCTSPLRSSTCRARKISLHRITLADWRRTARMQRYSAADR